MSSTNFQSMQSDSEEGSTIFTFFMYNIFMLLINFFVFAMYFIQIVVEHYQCHTKTGLDVTTLVEIGLALGISTLVFEMINAHIFMVYLRLKIIKDIRKYGFFTRSDIVKYRFSFCIDLYLQILNTFLAFAQFSIVKKSRIVTAQM